MYNLAIIWVSKYSFSFINKLDLLQHILTVILFLRQIGVNIYIFFLIVMAGNEGTPGSLAEDSLSARLQWLRQRREALQEKLALKNTELKNLCIEEAELTGVLPPEIPLEPGESPPTFRKKVGTAFTYPQNLINKLKSNEAVRLLYFVFHCTH